MIPLKFLTVSSPSSYFVIVYVILALLIPKPCRMWLRTNFSLVQSHFEKRYHLTHDYALSKASNTASAAPIKVRVDQELKDFTTFSLYSSVITLLGLLRQKKLTALILLLTCCYQRNSSNATRSQALWHCGA